jgi:hypothetical protein
VLGQPSATRRHAVRLLAGLLAPLIFVVLLEVLGNATRALAITEAIPLLWVVGYAIWRRKIEPVGTIAVAGFGIALLLTIALGGSPLPLELHRALFPGAVGLACLISLVARRPLLEIAKSRLAKTGPVEADQARGQLEPSDGHHALVVLTAIIGVTMSVDAAAQVTLALTVSTATFGVVAHVAAWVIIASGVAVCGLYLRTIVRRDRDRIGTPAPEAPRGAQSTPPPTAPGEVPR